MVSTGLRAPLAAGADQVAIQVLSPDNDILPTARALPGHIQQREPERVTRRRLSGLGDAQGRGDVHNGAARGGQHQGLSKRETIRCLKRYLAREIYRALAEDLNDLRLTT